MSNIFVFQIHDSFRAKINFDCLPQCSWWSTVPSEQSFLLQDSLLFFDLKLENMLASFVRLNLFHAHCNRTATNITVRSQGNL